VLQLSEEGGLLRRGESGAQPCTPSNLRHPEDVGRAEQGREVGRLPLTLPLLLPLLMLLLLLPLPLRPSPS
jgi:hypothetical protein